MWLVYGDRDQSFGATLAFSRNLFAGETTKNEAISIRLDGNCLRRIMAIVDFFDCDSYIIANIRLLSFMRVNNRTIHYAMISISDSALFLLDIPEIRHY